MSFNNRWYNKSFILPGVGIALDRFHSVAVSCLSGWQVLTISNFDQFIWQYSLRLMAALHERRNYRSYKQISYFSHLDMSFSMTYLLWCGKGQKRILGTVCRNRVGLDQLWLQENQKVMFQVRFIFLNIFKWWLHME